MKGRNRTAKQGRPMCSKLGGLVVEGGRSARTCRALPTKVGKRQGKGIAMCHKARGLLCWPTVNPSSLIEQIEAYLSSRGVPVCCKPLHAQGIVSGGLVKLNGRILVVVDSAAPQVERLMVLADALGRLGIDPGALSEDVRCLVTKARAKRLWRRKRLLGRLGGAKPLWLQSRLVSRSPGLRACKGNDRNS